MIGCLNLVLFQPLNERKTPVSVKEFSQISKQLEKLIRLGVKRALADNTMSAKTARKFLWSGQCTEDMVSLV